MLGVSLRLAEAADLGSALQKYIQANYTPDEAKAQRAKLVASVGRNASEQDHGATLQTFTSYYKTLMCLIGRFPFQSASRPVVEDAPSGFLNRIASIGNARKVPQVSLVTTWFDAFRHSNRAQDVDIAFERLSVLFDIAALYSRQATQIKAAVPTVGADIASAGANSSLKEACRLFQLSSGIFTEMARMPEIVTGQLGAGLTIDLTSDALAMLGVLMLAQAQACFFEAATTTASPKLVSKLAMGVSILFRDAAVRCEKNSRLRAIQGKPDVYPWAQHAAYQTLCYQAASHFWAAKGALAEDEYGVEIAHLERARAILAQARTKEAGLLRNLADNRAKLENTLSTRLAAASKDNETIYYAQIPKQDQLQDPEPLTAVKPLPMDSPGGISINPQTDDPFTFLVSPYLREQHETLRAKVGEVQLELGKRVSQAEQTSKSVLEGLGLPASLDALTDGKAGLPEDIWNQIREIQYKGGVAQLDGLNSRIESAVTEVQAAFQEVTAQLAKEAEGDAKMRTQFAHRWNRRPSEQLTVHLQKDADSVRRFLRDADASNVKVRAELDACKARFELLALPQAELEARLPRATAEQSQGSQEAVATLRRLLAELHDNSARLAQLQPAFQAKLEATDFMAQLLASNVAQGIHSPRAAAGAGAGADNAALLSAALEPFQSFHTSFDDSIRIQSELLEQIRSANADFLALRSSDDSTARRQAFLQQLNESVAAYDKLLANLNEGLKFYADLQRTKVAPLSQKVADFCMARNMEAQLILEQLTRASSGFDESQQPQQQSVFPDAGAGSGAASQLAGPPGGLAANSPQAGGGAPGSFASNPNLAFGAADSHLYNLQSPPPPAGGQGGQQQQQQQQHYQQQQQQAHAAQRFPQQAPQPQQHPPQPPPRPSFQAPPNTHVYGHVAQPQPPQYQPSHAHAPSSHPPPYVAPQQHAPQQQPFLAHFAHAQQAQQQQAQQQQQARAPAPVAAQPQWACAACTFLNPLSDHQCGMCGGKR